MVGVPGRSKGCNTCIQRKIKCDQTTPFCVNCRKSNRLCTGYQRRLGYVFSTNVSTIDLSGVSRDESGVTCQGRWRKSRPRLPGAAVYHIATPTWTEMSRSTSPSLCHQVSSNTAFRQQFHSIFLDDFMPSELLRDRQLNTAGPMIWLLRLQDIVIESSALESSVAALFTARVGRKKNDSNLVQRSRDMYGNSLSLIQQAINSPTTRFSDETLAACMALLYYELTEQPESGRAAMLTHGKGAMALLLQRGTDACASPLGHSLFITLRAQSVPTCLIRREDSFLSSAEWMEKPWKSIHKTPIDELTDSLYMLPAVFRQLDGLLNESCDSNLVELQDGFRDVIQKLLKTKSALNDIFREFERSVCGPLYWPELSILPSHLDDTQLGKVFPISFKFPAFTVSQFLTNYWSGLMAIHNQLMFTYCRLSMVQGAISAANLGDTSRSFPPRHSTSTSSSPASISSLKSSEHHNEWKNMARNLCQSAEYFLQGDKGEFGPLTLLMLLSGCYSCFKHFPAEMSREIGWVAEIQSQVQKKANLPFLDPYEDSVTVQQSGIVSNNATSLPTPFTLQQT